jgi:phosphoribosylaminoimidazolecarboxamide formyltransferase / IMP cyclohydrolase
MNKQIKSALISVFYKDGLEQIIHLLHKNNVAIYSTGGTQEFIEKLNVPCIPVESLTNYPSILGGRVKTLHPKVFGGILGKRADEIHLKEMQEFEIPELDLVIVDLYPFEETVASTNDEKLIIEKIDIGGPSMIRAAAKNYSDVVVLASKNDYEYLENSLQDNGAITSIEQRKHFATRAFQVVAQYDIAVANYFLNAPNNNAIIPIINAPQFVMRYGENPHQVASFYGDLNSIFNQLHGKALSYNNLVDVDAAMQLVDEFTEPTFAIVKHTNACGVAQRNTIYEAWTAALACDNESAFGGVLCCNGTIDVATATAISDIFFEVLIAQNFDEDALQILQQKKNRILLQVKNKADNKVIIKNLLNGVLVQQTDDILNSSWKEVGALETTIAQKEDLHFANIICKHLKSNAIALVKNKQLIGKGCGQTSRIDALNYALDKAKHFGFETTDAVLASDAFFPFDDCIKIAHAAGINAIIQPGGSMRDGDSITYAIENNIAMVLTETRHFKH